MGRTNPSIEQKAQEILQATGFDSIPVRIDLIAQRLGLTVEASQLGDDVSGILVASGETGTIGYSMLDASVRQRFTIAHELGHFVLHRRARELFIDKSYTMIYRRDQESSTGELQIEREANQFAAAILMPKHHILEEITKYEFDLGDEVALRSLADKFQVSTQAMSLRLAKLGFFSQRSENR